MQEQNFEKQVQQKMEELSFVPSEPVWQKVEKQISHKKDRRRRIFWLLPLVLLGGGYLVWSVSNNELIENKSSATLVTPTQKQNNKASNELTDHRNSGQLPPDPLLEQERQISSPVDEESNISQSFKDTQSDTHKRIISKTEIGNTKQKERTGINNAVVESTATDKNAIQNEIGDIKQKPNESAPSVANNIDNTVAGTVPVPSKEDTTSFVSNDSTTLNSSTSNIDSAAQLQNPKVVQATRIKKTWIVSVRASVGVSSISDDLNMFRSIIGSQNKSLADLFSGPSSVPPAGANFNNAAPIVLQPSPVYKGLTYSAGLDLRRALGKRLDIVSGINYQYFSTMHYVGRKVDNRSALSNQFTNARNTQEFYLNSSAEQSKYKTNYHFITIPLSVDYLLLKKKPLHVEAGIQLAQLLSTNALYFDKAASVYYENKGTFRNTQLLGTTGFSYRVLSSKGGSLYLGPQVQFGWTNLLAKKENGQQHLLSAGVHTRFTF